MFISDSLTGREKVYGRTWIVLLSTCLCLSAIVAVFWHQDWQYSMPAVRPADLQQPDMGAKLALASVGMPAEKSKPIFLHFFNPDCPCSRFNIEHVRALIRRHHRNVRFIAVLQGEGGARRLAGSFRKLDLGIESIVDEHGEIARLTGVYATPQAALIDPNGRLYYRGNYNLTRYCTSPETEFARIALDKMLAGRPSEPVNIAASTAYGCPRPIRR